LIHFYKRRMPSFPLKWEEISDEDRKATDAIFNEENPNMKDVIKFPEVNMTVPRAYLKIADDIYNFPIKDDDVWIVTFPKCGTTWMQETVWTLVNDVDEEKGKMPLLLRTPFLEMDCLMDGIKFPMTIDPTLPANVKEAKMNSKDGTIPYARNHLKGRRVIKSHMPFAFLHPELTEKCKVVYVCRTPKDCIVSYYYHTRNLPMHGFTGSFKDFATQFMRDNQWYGSYWAHLESGWKLRDHPNVKFIWYEDMKGDTKKVCTELAEFLNHPMTEKKIDELVHHISFDVMKNNPWSNPSAGMELPPEKDFMRKGKVGDWKNHFSGDELAKIDDWIQENLERTGIVLPQM